MNIVEMKLVARAIVAKQKGVLAADESGPTIKKRFDAIKLESTEENIRTRHGSHGVRRFTKIKDRAK